MTSFVGPAPNTPIDAVQFISFLDLSPIITTLRIFYIEPYMIRHPPEAFLKLLAIQKLKRYKCLTKLYGELDDQTTRLLGFKYKPSYKTLWHWLNKRVGPDGLEIVHTEMIKIINQTLAAQGTQISKIVCADATHIAAQSNDKQATYNGHYKMRCYLLHHLICEVTGLTLNWVVTPGNVDEGQFMVRILAKTLADGFRPELLALDNGYAHYFNYEIPNFLGIKLLIGFRKRNNFSWRGKPKTLKLRYRKMIKAGKLTLGKLAERGIQPDPEKNSLEEIICTLAIVGKHVYAGAYFRNQSLALFRRNRKCWLSLYSSPRTVIEGTHGHQKDLLDLNGLVEKGLRKARLHAQTTLYLMGRYIFPN